MHKTGGTHSIDKTSVYVSCTWEGLSVSRKTTHLVIHTYDQDDAKTKHFLTRSYLCLVWRPEVLVDPRHVRAAGAPP